MLIESILIFFAASIVLVKSASYAVKSVSSLAEYLRFSPFFISFILAGFVSIFPELFIGINSALYEAPEIGIGTIIGSNVADMTLLIGIIALIGKKIKVDKKTIKNNLYFVTITALPILLMIDGNLTRDDGLILIFACVFYFWTLIKKEKIFSKAGKKKNNLWKNLSIFFLSMIFLFISAHYMVESGEMIAVELGTPEIIIGLFLMAIGTTLPELTFSLKAVLSKHKEIALGDIMGNVSIDATFTIGVVALISPLYGNFVLIIMSTMFMILGVLVVTTLMSAGKKITWEESFLLFFIYIMFVATMLIMDGISGTNI